MPNYTLNIIVEGRDRASGALGGVQKALGNVAQFALGGVLANGLVRIGQGIAGVAREALSGATDMQNLTLALETLAARELVAAGGADTIEEALAEVGPVAAGLKEQLRDLSLVSPFEAKQVEDAFRLQMAFGATGESAIELAGAILDTGAGLGLTNDAMGRMSYNLAQALQAGDLTAANMRQLKMVGLDLADVFSDQLGLSIEEVREGLKAGELTMADVSQAFVKHASENFGGAAERMSRTFSGLKSSVKDLLYYGGADLLTPLLERASDFLGGLFDRARGLVESGALVAVGERIGGIVDVALAFIDQVGAEGIGALFPPEVVGNVQELLAGLAPVGEVLRGEIIPAVVESLPTLQLWGEQLLILASEALPLLAGGLQFVAEHWEVFAAGAGVVGAVILALNVPIVALVGALAGLYLAWVNDWGGIRSFIEGTVAAISGLVSGWLATLQGWWSAHGGSVTTIVGALWSNVQARFEAGRAFVQGLIQAATTLWNSIWTGHGSTIMQVAQLAWSNVQAVIGTVTAVISALLDAWAAAVEGDWSVFGEHLRTAWDAVWSGIVTILRNGAMALLMIVADLISSVVSKFTDTDWGSVGRGIIDGVVEGIRATASRLAQAAIDAAQAAIDAVRGLLGIGSPSQTFYEIGRQIAEGLINGILDSAEDVQAAWAEMLDVAAVLSGLGGAAAQRLKKTLDPLAAEVEALDERIGFLKNAMAAAGRGTPEYRARFEELERAQRERNRAAREYERIQERLLRLQVAQENLAFLQQQVKLLDVIAEHGLDASEILLGLKLGVDANLEGVIAAMTRAMEAIIGGTEDELGISSPSRVFAEIGQRMMEGLAAGIRGGMRIPAMAAAGAVTSMTQNYNYTMNVNTRATSPTVIQDFAVMRALAG